MKNNITIKDVAREAGVSVATVSYVINERNDKRISDKTRKKVLQVINLLGYTPNQSAKALATSRSGMVALYVTPDFSTLKNAEQLHFINFLSSFLHKKNYDLIYLSDTYTEKFDHADAILCYDVSLEYFLQIGDNNFAPLIALDCMINDPLFFQVNSDYEKMAQQACAYFHSEDYALLLLETPNLERKEYLKPLFQMIVSKTIRRSAIFQRLPPRKLRFYFPVWKMPSNVFLLRNTIFWYSLTDNLQSIPL